jgi:hypothetical protein
MASTIKLPFYLLVFAMLLGCINSLHAQTLPRRTPGTTPTTDVQYDRNGRVIPKANRQDTGFKKRDDMADSITISYRLFDSTRIMYVDSNINDFSRRYPVPPDYVTLGNFGTAAHSLIFKPNLRPGWDAGFHAFDVYKFRIEDTRLFQTTRPYTELGYMLGGSSEQMVNITHTQNVRPNFNLAFQYRFINSPGNFKNQNTNHNSFRINGNYTSNNKRYNAYGIYISNKLLSSENGGVRYDTVLSDDRFNDRFVITTRLGGDLPAGRNFFNTNVRTGNLYRESIILFRQQYDFGQKDSIIVNDSTTIRLFYPRFRLQHTLKYSTQQYEFRDQTPYATKRTDYRDYFNFTISQDTLDFIDKWTEVVNDFSIISFPEKNNLNQFIRVGAAIQNLKGDFTAFSKNYYNAYFTGEYRNRTRNQKWNITANGQFYLAGLNAADYSAQVSLQRFLSRKLGSIELGFQNVNRSPSFIFRSESNFPVILPSDLKKENISRLFGSINNTAGRFSLNAEYFLVSNYTYFDNFFSAKQEGTLFNILHISGQKTFRLSKRWSLFSEVHLQKETGDPPINIPLLFTNNRINFEANLYKNLYLATGFEVRYHTPYKADNYSPFLGQYFYQNSVTINNRPVVNAFFDFNIKSFRAFVRAENLNALRVSGGNFGFTKENFTAEHYPNQGLWIRLGIWWTFVN